MKMTLKGFTLAEMIVAMVILVITSLMAYTGFMTSADFVRRTAEYDAAADKAASALETASHMLREGASQGEILACAEIRESGADVVFSDASRRLQFREPVSGSTSYPAGTYITVTVPVDDGTGDGNNITLTAFVCG
ncbi:MAG: type II secretion system protein [Huintestinicola sp.]